MRLNEETPIDLCSVEINIYKPTRPVRVPIVENNMATRGSGSAFTRHVAFDVSGTELENRVVPGQSLGIIPEGVDEKGKPHKVRLYSICSPTGGEDGKGKIYATTVKRVIDEHWHDNELFLGVCSNYLCNRKPGELIHMTGPSGKRFLLPGNSKDFNYVFLATGTGIAPFRGMIMDLMRSDTTNDMVLIFGCPYRTDVIYPELFEELEQKHNYFHYLKAISREKPRPDGSKQYVQYVILDEKEWLLPVLKKENTLIYVCGLKGMETGIFKVLGHLGLFDYLQLKEEAIGHDPEHWTDEWVKTAVKPGARMFLEVY
ncbi:MAG: hypothetical protein WD097_06335 [Balneolales bacterium]